METNATRMCALLVGLPDVNVIGVEDDEDKRLFGFQGGGGAGVSVASRSQFGRPA